MIKIELNYSDEFLERYRDQIVTGILVPACNNLLVNSPAEYNEAIRTLFTGQALDDLIFMPPELLLDTIFQVYDQIPILAERYCLEYYLRDLEIDASYADWNLRTNIGKGQIRRQRDNVVIELEAIIAQKRSVLISDIILQMRRTESASVIKKHLNNLISMSLGKYTLSDIQKDLFDEWVQSFSNIFNYDQMAKALAHEMTGALQIDVCPYCNYEDTETISAEGANTRPDLDHFHPKSKFPFFALTLSNLIPSGHRCNQKYKKSKVMFDYEHPYLNGVGPETVFDFNFNFDEGRIKDNLQVVVNEIGSQVNNMNFFKIAEVFNKNDIKDWFLEFHERYEYRRSLDLDGFNNILNNESAIRLELAFDVLKSPRVTQAQKFKIDALRKLSGRYYALAE
jgi:hypothetical protein